MNYWFQHSIVATGKLRLFCLGGVHVHHVVFGLAMMCVGGVGSLAVQNPRSGWAAGTAALLGIGMALVLDEFALVLHLKDVYWSEQGRLSVEVVFIAVAMCGLALLGFAPLGVTASSERDLGAWLGLALVLVFNLGLTIICLLKGKVWSGVIGVYISLFALVGAIRVARPGSAWARSRYPAGSRKLAKAVAREERYARPVTRLMAWTQDAIAGRPDRSHD
jgi:hypothetical protein